MASGDSSIRPLGMGRIIEGDTPYGRYSIDLNHNYTGPVFDAAGQAIGRIDFEIRTPRPTLPIPDDFEQPAPRLSPGSLLTTAIKLITGTEPGPNCQCKARARKMDEWGWMKCWRERRTIATWLTEEARKRGHDMDDAGAMQFVRAAWKEIRQRRKDEATRTP